MSEPRILVVDDSPTMRRIIVNTLNRVGYSDMVEAADGRDALSKMKKGSFDLIITDWNMPKMDGVTLVKILRRSQGYHDVPILMVTTRSVQEDIVAAIEAGVNSYVIKPFTPRVLKEKIGRMLAGIRSVKAGEKRP